MDRDYLKEKLINYRNFLTLFWTGLFVLGGGLIHYHNDLSSLFKKTIFSTGLIFEIGLILVTAVMMIEIKRLLKKVKESKNV